MDLRIGVYKSADPPKFEAKSAIRAKILDKSAICCINKIRNPCKTFARSEIRTIFSVKSDDPKTYSPLPPPPLNMTQSIKHRLDLKEIKTFPDLSNSPETEPLL